MKTNKIRLSQKEWKHVANMPDSDANITNKNMCG